MFLLGLLHNPLGLSVCGLFMVTKESALTVSTDYTRSQWRIQNFPEMGAPTFQERSQHTILPNFPEFHYGSKISLCRSATGSRLQRVRSERTAGVPCSKALLPCKYPPPHSPLPYFMIITGLWPLYRLSKVFLCSEEPSKRDQNYSLIR